MYWEMGYGFIVILLLLLVIASVRILREYERGVVMDVPDQNVITRDNVSVKVNAVVYARVVDPQLAQTTLRAILGKHELDQLLSEREKINQDLQQVLDEQTEAWGIKVANVEIKHVDLNENMIRAIAKQAEAERERRAKIIHAEGELQASAKLLEAAQTLSQAPQAMQLRYLKTLTASLGKKVQRSSSRCPLT